MLVGGSVPVFTFDVVHSRNNITYIQMLESNFTICHVVVVNLSLIANFVIS